MDVPFIKLFQTPNQNYFLDVNQNELVPISNLSYTYLNNVLLNREDSRLPVTHELLDLKERGYLNTESIIKEVRHSYSDFLGLFLTRKISKITLQITQNCNFRCKYCVYSQIDNPHQRNHSNQRMNWAVAKKAVDFLKTHSIDSESVNIGFYGGEPLLEFQLIKKVVAYSNEQFRGKEITYSITTNGTLLNTEIIKFLEKHDISLLISLDGPKEINDQNRVFVNGEGTYDKVTANIELIKKLAPEYAEKIQISMVIDPSNDFDCINSIYIDSSELNEVNLQSALVDREFVNIPVSYSEDFAWKFEYQKFLSILAHFGRFPEQKVSPIAKNVLRRFVAEDYYYVENGVNLRYTDAPSGPCIPGQMRLFVDISGKLFPCERVSETSKATCIGTLDTGFDLEKADHFLNVGRLTEANCKNCWCFRYCMICGKKADDGSSKLSLLKKLSHCSNSMDNAYYTLKQYLLFKEIPIYYSKQVQCAFYWREKDL